MDQLSVIQLTICFSQPVYAGEVIGADQQLEFLSWREIPIFQILLSLRLEQKIEILKCFPGTEILIIFHSEMLKHFVSMFLIKIQYFNIPELKYFVLLVEMNSNILFWNGSMLMYPPELMQGLVGVVLWVTQAPARTRPLHWTISPMMHCGHVTPMIHHSDSTRSEMWCIMGDIIQGESLAQTGE